MADLSWVARIIRASEKRLVLEDFHYVSEENRKAFSFILKALGDYGVYVILVGIWPEDHLLTYYNGNLDGRVEDLRLVWADEDLAAVLDKGCDALNIAMTDGLVSALVGDAFGNVGLIQRLAEQVCINAGVLERQDEEKTLDIGQELDGARAAGAPVLCRWQSTEPRLILDVTPTDADIVGFSNPWYEEAIATAATITLNSGAEIRAATPVLLVATKLCAWKGRGRGDLLRSLDVHDVLTLIDGRPELIEEIKAAPWCGRCRPRPARPRPHRGTARLTFPGQHTPQQTGGTQVRPHPWKRCSNPALTAPRFHVIVE